MLIVFYGNLPTNIGPSKLLYNHFLGNLLTPKQVNINMSVKANQLLGLQVHPASNLSIFILGQPKIIG